MSLTSLKEIKKQVKTLRIGLALLGSLLVIAIVCNIILFIFISNNLNSNQKTQDTQTASNTANTKATTNNQLIKDYQTITSTFYNDNSVSQIGYMLEIKKESLSTINTTNCFTPEVPPIENGCGFNFRPYATGISNVGTRLLSITFEAQMGNEDLIALDVINTEQNKIVSSLERIMGKDQIYSAKLPYSLAPNEQILVRLWPKRESSVTVSRIYVDYLDKKKLQNISLELSSELFSKVNNSTMNIYLDTNKNQKFDQDIDLLWICNEQFPGVQQNKISSQKIQLKRDDSCLDRESREIYGADDYTLALGPYLWLAVFKTENNSTISSPFEIITTQDTYQLQ